MKIVQSFWSKPLLNAKHIDRDTVSIGGWPDFETFLASWALSAMSIQKCYQNLNLYTDGFGKRVLIDLLELPYENCHEVFDSIYTIDSSFWAAGKLFVYKSQEVPFIHMDGDIFIWEKLNSELFAGEIFAQNREENFGLYHNLYTTFLDGIALMPKEVKPYFEESHQFEGINMGVFGGNNIKFIKEYANSALTYVLKNQKFLLKKRTPYINHFFEQFLLKCFVSYYDIKVSYLFDTISNDFQEVLKLHHAPFKSKYVHIVGSAKKNELIAELILLNLKAHFPNVYDRLQKILPEAQHLLLNNTL